MIEGREMHEFARGIAERLLDPDRRQLRFNEIIACAVDFYPNDVSGGIAELVQSCDRAHASLYVKAAPMWQVLRSQYGWILS